jgi:hypothetical protein
VLLANYCHAEKKNSTCAAGLADKGRYRGAAPHLVKLANLQKL